MSSRPGVRLSAATVLLLCTTVALPARAENNREQELESVRSEILDVETNLRAARDESEQLYTELHEMESLIIGLTSRLADIDEALAEGNNRLQQLDGKQAQLQETIAGEKLRLAKQIRTAFISGRHNTIKLVLNQEDPAQMGRLIAYNDYFNRARSQRIAVIDSALLENASLRNEIENESRTQRLLQKEQQTKLRELTDVMQQRVQVLARLDNFIASKDNELRALKQTEAKLLSLFNELSSDTSILEKFEEVPPFASLKGNLDWPVAGSIDLSFGAYRKGGRIRSMGITFHTRPDAIVRAVASGRIIFADWFRNLGLLLIIDHGDDYMSLYGHNKSLSKKKGDWVDAGEEVSRAGETGGRTRTSLYFEVRKKGTPLNPAHWCKK